MMDQGCDRVLTVLVVFGWRMSMFSKTPLQPIYIYYYLLVHVADMIGIVIEVNETDLTSMRQIWHR